MKTFWKVLFLTAVFSVLVAGVCSAKEIIGAFQIPLEAVK